MDVIFPYLKEIVEQIPKGKVTTFKIVSEFLGSEYSIKYVLQNYKKLNGWWRIVNEKGIIYDEEQKRRLIEEGIEIEGNRIKDIDKYLFKEFNVRERILEKYIRIQNELRERIILEDKFEKIELIGGVDLSYKNNIGKVVYVLLDKDMNLLDKKISLVEVNFPYIPTFLSFREGEAILKTIDKIDRPDILFVNGQGVAHPRRMGLATYIGVLKNIPTIGVTKKNLYGRIVDGKILDENNNLLGYEMEKFGNKIYISPGNLVSFETSKELSYKFWIKGRYPEPIRLADYFSKKD